MTDACALQPLPTQQNLSLASSLLEALSSERSKRETQIQTIYDALYLLWMRLGVDEEFAESFVEQHAGISAGSLAAYQAEMDRMEQVKRANMADFIAKERVEVKRLRELLYMLPEDAEDEDRASEEEATDEMLELVETERQTLEAELVDKKPVLDLLARYFTLLAEIHELQVCLPLA